MNCKIGNSNAKKKEEFWSLYTKMNWKNTKINLMFLDPVSIFDFYNYLISEYPELVYSSDDDNTGNKRKK
jgi:hypothetical protein